jgi:hypothetical protein
MSYFINPPNGQSVVIPLSDGTSVTMAKAEMWIQSVAPDLLSCNVAYGSRLSNLSKVANAGIPGSPLSGVTLQDAIVAAMQGVIEADQGWAAGSSTVSTS